MTDEIQNTDSQESEIDLMEMASTLWKQRRKIFKWCGWAAVIALVVAFSIPREYTATVRLAPEMSDSRTTGGLSALASMAGLNLNAARNVDAVNPMLYPDVVNSVPFMTGLFNIEVKPEDSDTAMTFQTYVLKYTRSPWWGYVIGAPFQIIGMLLPAQEEEEGHVLDNFQLTRDEYDLLQFLQHSIIADFDMKTSIVSINVTTQDPVVSATMADTVLTRLKNYITEYRTDKARKDLEYAIKINQEAKDNYYAAQQKYADFQDRNQGLAFHVAQTQRERLSNEASLAFSLYNQTAQQVQLARAKVQENTPVYAVIDPATVPVRPSAPRRALILIGFVFLAFVTCSAWILFGKPMWESFKSKSDDNASEADNDKASEPSEE